MNTENGIAVLKEVVHILDNLAIEYWLGRGVFRHYTQYGELGQNQYDIDLHIHLKDRGLLLKGIQELERNGYELLADNRHKILIKNIIRDIEIEFVFLFPCTDSLVYHQTKGQRLICDLDCFGNRTIGMFGVRVRVPEEKYLEQVYGNNWRY